MKKTYLLGFSTLLSLAAVAQISAETRTYKLNTTFDGNSTVVTDANSGSQDRAGGDIIWQNNFNTSTNWIATAPVGAGSAPDYGWSIGNTVNTWASGFDATMNTTGNYARFRNGTSSTEFEGGPFTFEFDSVFNLSAVPAPNIAFEQYGARFITVQAVQVSVNGGTTWTTVGTNNDIPPLTSGGGSDYPNPMTRTYNISAAIAADPTNVRIRLFWDGAMNGPSMNYIDYGWYVDNIRIVEGYSYDLQNEGTHHRSGVGTIMPTGMPYYMIPTTQITTIDFAGTVSNQGALTHTGTTLNVSVNNGSVVYTGTSTPINLAPNATDSVSTATQFTPSSIGTYDVTYWFDGTNTEEITNNDTTYDSFEVTAYTYAKDNGIQAGGIAEVTSTAGGTFSIGNVFEIFEPGVIGAVDIFITDLATNDDLGQEIYAEVYKWDGSQYTLQSSSENYQILPGDLDGFIKLVLNDPVTVAAGDDILILSAHYGGTPIEIGTAQALEEGTVLGFTNGSLFSLIAPEAPMVRADMRDFTAIEEESASTFAIGQNVPNPFNNSSVITYTLNEASNVSVQITDVTGKVVQTITPGSQVAGTYTLTIDAANLADGMYFYTFTVGNEIVTKQMVVSKK
ncbi:MAG: T9SS type A sorting domain-containing protein [Crocinitomicaceae bacterium]|nr:T9SS type A sorting domain-containing protein [Crocinitomicaceae bacterium]MBK9590206.1 T9SS type A sorting domain-containing protein [Crocinitomicaceae bacterium]